MPLLPFYLYAGAVIITVATVAFMYFASRRSSTFLLIMAIWLGLQAILSINLFYLKNETVPPRFLLILGPPIFYIIMLFITTSGKKFTDQLQLKWLTLLHVIRLPVELMLFGLYYHKAVPSIMTFEGGNFDILSGVSAPFIFYFSFVRRSLSRKVLLAWNIVCLLLVLHVVIKAILAIPSPIQQLAFDQPNVAVLYFPFVWLPCCIVPLVVYAHLTAMRQLIQQTPSKSPD